MTGAVDLFVHAMAEFGFRLSCRDAATCDVADRHNSVVDPV
jgi:hypothetical protein